MSGIPKTRGSAQADKRLSPFPFRRAPPYGEAVRALKGASIVSSLDFNRALVSDLYSLAAQLESERDVGRDSLAGRIILTAFFEPSTRTRLSFESAALRLGGRVISVADGYMTSAQKGESLADTGVMFGSYADIVVFRHSRNSSIEEIRSIGCSAAVVNAGNGSREHPTQALADWYTVLKWKASRASILQNSGGRLSIGIVGDLSVMRTLRSFLLLGASCFPDYIEEVTLINDTLQADISDVIAVMERMRIRWCVCQEKDADLSRFDVIYINSLTLENGSYRPSRNTVKLSRRSPLKPTAIILHPLARQDELSTDLDNTPHNLYFAQAAGAVFVRQALLLALAGCTDRIMSTCAE